VTKTWRTLALLFGLALTARLLFGAWSGALTDPTPVEDEQGYVEIAQTLGVPMRLHDENGRVLAESPREFVIVRDYPALIGFSGPPNAIPYRFERRRSFRAPIAPLAFAPVAAAGGGVEWMRVVAMLFGALGPPLLFLALRKSALGDRAWWSALAYALWPPAVYVSVRALSEAPSQALLLGAVALLVSERKRASGWAGALAGLAVLARPSALIPAGLLAFATGSIRRGLLFLLVFVVVVDVWVARNWQLHGRPMLTSNSGVTLVGGNSRAALDTEHPGKWVQPERVYADAEGPPDLGTWGWSFLSEEQSDARFTHDAVTWVRENPGDAAKLAFWKVVRLFDPDPHSEKDDATSKAVVGWLTFAPVLLLAAIGARRGERVWWLLLAGTVATAIIFYGDTRMRTCADPALLVFAAYGATLVAGRLRGRAVD
jgi:hypothetical protein